ncbi:hypothetical protein ABPG74_013061 [Tetrahymena malaccensis]
MESQNFSLPENKNLYILAKREKIEDKSFLEKAGDFLFTFGNEAYYEHYYIIQQRNSGSYYVYQKILINEYNAGSFRGIEEFDYTEQYKKQIQLFSQITKILNKISSGQSIEKEMDQLKQLIGDKTSQITINNLDALGGHIAKLALIGGAAGIQKIVAYTSLQTFRIVNNALVKEGIKGFMSIGGKQFLKEGVKAVVSQQGKTLLTGTVTSVTQNTVTIGTQAAKTGFQIGSFLKGLGIGLAVNVVIGGIKALANTQWQKETVFVCYCHESFNFEIISNHDKFTEQLKLDLKYLDQLQSKLNEFDQIIG